MDKDTKRLLGKILGEVFRLQRAQGIATSGDKDQIYGLLYGFEDVLDEVSQEVGEISSEKVKVVTDVLEQIWQDPQKLEKFTGFYDIEQNLSQQGVSRVDAMKILTYLKAGDRFSEVINKMDSSNSPGECRTFELYPWEDSLPWKM